MRAYFRKFQTVCAASADVRDQLGVVHCDGTIGATKGPIQATLPRTVLGLQRAWVETFRSLGLENRSDPLDGEALGGHISTCHIDVEKGERSHAGSAYFEPVRDRANLHLVTEALVQRIVFNCSSGQDAVATGVEYLKNGVRHHVRVHKEVLLAAGTFATPQLLELSGIGDSALLRHNGIEKVYHNPNVGENLQDHIRPGLSFEAADGVEAREPVPASEARKLYEENRTGPWAEKACYTFAYMPLDHFLSTAEKEQLCQILNEYLDRPDLPEFQQKRNAFVKKMILSPTEATATAFLSRKPGAPDPEGGNWITLFAMLSHPFSRGSVHISSSDAAVKPKIHFGYYTHPLDLEVHARHIQVLEKLASTAPLSEYIKKNGARLPLNSGNASLAEAKELIKGYSTTNYHPCGTCSIMPESMGGVVDSSLRVYGTKNVRVADAAIMPIIPRGNIITTVYAVAEKAADIVSKDLGLSRLT